MNDIIYICDYYKLKYSKKSGSKHETLELLYKRRHYSVFCTQVQEFFNNLNCDNKSLLEDLEGWLVNA